MNKKSSWIVVGVVFFVAIANYLVNIKDRSDLAFQGNHFGMSSRTLLAPAATAEEWLKRWDLDLHAYGSQIEHQYAELPPMEEWDALFRGLKERLARTNQEMEKLFGRFTFDEPDKMRAKYRFFIAAMRGDEGEIESTFQHLIRTGNLETGNTSERIAITRSLSGDPDEALEWLRENRRGWFTENRSSSHRSVKSDWETLLAAGKTAEALDRMWALANAGNGNILGKILTISRLVEDGPMEQRALKAIRLGAEKSNERSSDLLGLWIDELEAQGRWEEVRTLTKRHPSKKNDFRSRSKFHTELAASYHLDGPEAFLDVIDKHLQSEQMNEAEALGFLQSSYSRNTDLGDLYVKSLAAIGKKDEALALALRILAVNRRSDPAYQRVHQLDPAAFAGFLDRLAAYDPFEERPLIWKAELALAAGNAAEAKALIDAAIALDPADGDQGKGYRMRAYEVLAAVHAALGETEQAAFFNEVVASIRDGEKADEFRIAGMIGESVERYRAALGRFNDAYCLQSRLALTLARDGRFAEAVPHFEKAFELMPVSFGPRESHCFGCEGLFNDERITPIAERVLSEFIDRDPDNARAPYLLGLVLEQMNRPEEAVEAFSKALALDPIYYHAAQRWLNNLEQLPGRFHERKALIETLVEIAPYPDIGRYFGMRTDLRQAWLDAADIRPSPLELPPFPIRLTPPKDQYKEDSGSFYYFHRSDHASLDGWTAPGIRRFNRVMELLR